MLSTPIADLKLGEYFEMPQLADIIESKFEKADQMFQDISAEMDMPAMPTIDSLEKILGMIPEDDTQITDSHEWTTGDDLSLDPDAYSTYSQIVNRYGFNYSADQVTTVDGYQLTVMHITSKTMANGAPAVFLQHGLFSSAEWWIMNAENSPAFILARAGFDVWLGNNRGSAYSRKNDHINPDK